MSWYPNKKCKPLTVETVLKDEAEIKKMQHPWINIGYKRVNINGFYHFVPYREMVYPDGRVEECH